MGSVFSYGENKPILNVRPISSLKPGSLEFKSLCEDLVTEGFCVIGLENQFKGELDTLYTTGNAFFQLDQATKEVHSDPKKENMGYLQIGTIREYLKLRRDGDRTNNWPQTPSDTKNVFIKALDIFHDLSWGILKELNSYALTYTDPTAKPFSETDWQSIKDALYEVASINITHYYPQPPQADSLVDVCDCHKDTGILTFVVVSDVPGLQVYDRKNKKWLEIEALLRPQRETQHMLMVLMGEKIQMFTGSTALTPTFHQVLIPPNVRRDSLLYFMDVSP